ncbi:MAG TPA: BlaI/MecI/CopY family transcriptional regulator [Gammaproteobacteria bacterium]|nr:BlaI/MecI/CopY family transcriptional regulator [Gammaproteobacteria bacterium]
MEFSLTDREASLMEVLWERGPSTVAEVRAELSDELAYTTVLTILRNLEGKGYVTHEEEGRAHRYAALVARDAAQRSALKALKQKLFQGSTELLLTRLVAEKDLSKAQIERIQRLLDQQPKRGAKK